jgi:hypothetical protein
MRDLTENEVNWYTNKLQSYKLSNKHNSIVHRTQANETEK